MAHLRLCCKVNQGHLQFSSFDLSEVRTHEAQAPSQHDTNCSLTCSDLFYPLNHQVVWDFLAEIIASKAMIDID